MDPLPDDPHHLRSAPASDLMFLVALITALGLVIVGLLTWT